MKTLDCGCEITPDGASLLSLCSMHGGFYRQQAAVNSLRAPRADDGRRWELTLAIAPEMVRKATSMDANTVAQAIDNHVEQILARQA